MNIEKKQNEWKVRGISKLYEDEGTLIIEYCPKDEKSHEYIYYKNVSNFTIAHKDDIKDLKPDSVYEIEFLGYVEESLECKLFINTYSKENQLSVNSISIGKKNIIYTDELTEFSKISIRVSGSGKAYIEEINLNCIKKEEYINKLVRSKDKNDSYLVLTNVYPSENDLYRNAFVHSRVKLYKENDLNIDVYTIKPKGNFLCKYNFENVDVITGDYDSLELLLKSKNYKKILIHFVNPNMINSIKKVCPEIKLVIWLHGIEASGWRRRMFNHTKEEIEKNEIKWDAEDKVKMEFLRSIYRNPNYTFIVVSNWFKEEICEKDAKCKILNCNIIPNVINEKIFKYNPKDKDARTKILSIRSYASNNYANDLSIKAILELSKKSYFNELEFNIYGKGILFNSLTSQIEHFENVNIHETFLTSTQLPKIHEENGVFLCPTRLDTQGVSMGEAMSSGLVPISTDISAISEYVEDGVSGILGRPESYIDIVNAIDYLYKNPKKYLSISSEASKFVQSKCGSEVVINKEIDIITS